MFLDKVILLSTIAASVYADFTNMKQDRAIEVTNCFDNLLCNYNPAEFKRLAEASGNEEVNEGGIDSLSSIYEVKYSGDIDRFLTDLHDKLCKQMDYKERTSKFPEFGAFVLEEYENCNCNESKEHPHCKSYDDGMEEMEKMVKEHQEKGTCCDKSKPQSKRCQEDSKLAIAG